MLVNDKFLFLTFTAAVSAAIVVGCSSGKDGGSSSGAAAGAGSLSSVDPAKVMNELSDSEANQYCSDMTRYTSKQLSASDTKKIACGIGGQIYGGTGAASNADAKSKCKTGYDGCMQKSADPDTNPSEEPCADFQKTFGDCTATVGEVSKCLADQATALKALASKDLCSEAKAIPPNGKAPSTLADALQAASCKAIQSKCPSVTGGKSND